MTASKDAELRKGWTPSGVPTRILNPEERWIMRSHIDWEEN